MREEEHQASAAVLKAACGHVSRRTRSLRDELVGDSAAAWTRLTALTLQSAAAAGRLKADVAKVTHVCLTSCLSESSSHPSSHPSFCRAAFRVSRFYKLPTWFVNWRESRTSS